MPDYVTQRYNMAASQVFANGVVDERLVAAFREVPRERFVPAAKRETAYLDAPIEIVHGRWLLAPATFARLVQLAGIYPLDQVLDVGCLTGYSTAVLARLSSRVVGLEEDAELVRSAVERLHEMPLANAQVVQGALFEGHRPTAPYDAIVVNGGIESVPTRLLAQLGEGGRLVAIRQHGVQGRAILYLKENGQTGHRLAFDASAAVLSGFRETAGFVF